MNSLIDHFSLFVTSNNKQQQKRLESFLSHYPISNPVLDREVLRKVTTKQLERGLPACTIFEKWEKEIGMLERWAIPLVGAVKCTLALDLYKLDSSDHFCEQELSAQQTTKLTAAVEA